MTDEMHIHKTDGFCKNCCCKRDAVLHQQETVSGTFHYVWKCEVCNVSNPFRGNLFISKRAVLSWMNEDQMRRLPKIMPPFENPPCERCGEKKTELHHWGPRGIMPDPEDWPQTYLCRKCHHQWHAMVTPNLLYQD